MSDDDKAMLDILEVLEGEWFLNARLGSNEEPYEQMMRYQYRKLCIFKPHLKSLLTRLGKIKDE